MNLNLFNRQFVSGLCNVRLGVVAVIGAFLIVFHYWTSYHAQFLPTPSPPTFLRYTMVFSGDPGSATDLYLFILPFLAALVGGSVYAKERLSGRLSELVVRTGRMAAMRTSLCSGFLLGGVGGTLPLLLNMIYAFIRTPHMTFIDGTPSTAKGLVPNVYVLIQGDAWLYPLYAYNQILFVIVTVLLIFLYSGLFATIAVGSSFFIRRKNVEIAVPFVLSVVYWMFPALFTNDSPLADSLSQSAFLHVSLGGSPRECAIGAALMAIGCLTIIAILYLVERNRDVE